MDLGSNKSRKDTRAVVSLVARYRSPSTFEYVQEACCDVSVGGMFIQSQDPAAAGTLLKLECEADRNGSKIRGVARVVWLRLEPNEYGPSGMGVKFVKLEPGSKEVITRVVQELAAAGIHAASISSAPENRSKPPVARASSVPAATPAASPSPAPLPPADALAATVEVRPMPSVIVRDSLVSGVRADLGRVTPGASVQPAAVTRDPAPAAVASAVAEAQAEPSPPERPAPASDDSASGVALARRDEPIQRARHDQLARSQDVMDVVAQAAFVPDDTEPDARLEGIKKGAIGKRTLGLAALALIGIVIVATSGRHEEDPVPAAASPQTEPAPAPSVAQPAAEAAPPSAAAQEPPVKVQAAAAENPSNPAPNAADANMVGSPQDEAPQHGVTAATAVAALPSAAATKEPSADANAKPPASEATGSPSTPSPASDTKPAVSAPVEAVAAPAAAQTPAQLAAEAKAAANAVTPAPFHPPLAPGETAYVATFVSKPLGATVTVRDQVVTTPSDMDLGAMKPRVRVLVEKPGYESSSIWLERNVEFVRSGEVMRRRLYFVLKQLPASGPTTPAAPSP